MHLLIVDDEPLARDELTYLLKNYDPSLKIDQADGIETALSALVQSAYDVIFLDIHLSDQSGMTLAATINKMAQPPVIIFATAYDQYALEAFEQNARDYLLKPYDEKRLAQAMDKVKASRAQGQADQPEPKVYPPAHPIEKDDRIYMVATDSLVMIEAQQGLILVHTQDKVYEDHATLVYWEDKLDPAKFMRVHRAFIINLDKVVTIEPWFNQTLQVTLSNGQKAQVSRSKVRDFKDRMGLT
ncbi:TPA: LytTR family transcriptional regulator DNA-binding domain-containing protein [Streptococcus suis]